MELVWTHHFLSSPIIDYSITEEIEKYIFSEKFTECLFVCQLYTNSMVVALPMTPKFLRS